MGNFYVSLTVRSTAREEIGNLLAGRNAYISPVSDGIVVVYDKEADTQDWPLIETLGKLLSDRLATAVLATLNHDDDILAYGLYERGMETDSYNSTPDYFEETSSPRGPTGGNATVLCQAFDAMDIDAVQAVLSKPGVEADDGYVFALDRHSDLMRALGYTQEFFFCGYRYLEAGEFPANMKKDDFVETSGIP